MLDGMTTTDTTFDPQKAEEFLGSADRDLHRLDAHVHDRHRPPHRSAHRGRGRPGARASRSPIGPALTERYVREWLGAMVTGGIVEYDPAAATYSLPPDTRGRADRRADEPRADGAAEHAPRQARPSGRPSVPRGRRRAVRGVPPRVHRRHGRDQPHDLRFVAGRRLPATRAGAGRAARGRRARGRRRVRHRARARAARARVSRRRRSSATTSTTARSHARVRRSARRASSTT